MKRTVKSKTLSAALIAALLFAGLSFLGLGETTSAEDKTPALAAASSPAESTIPGDDQPLVSPELLRNEIEGMQRYGSLLSEYLKQFEAVTDSKNPDPAKIAGVESQLQALRRQLPGMLGDLRACVKKLRDAGKWGKESDDYFEANAVKRNVPRAWVDYAKSNGGARSVFEKGIANFTRLSSAFDKDEKVLAELKTRKVSWLERLESIFIQSVHAKQVSAAAAAHCVECAGYIVMVVISGVPTAYILVFIANNCAHACGDLRDPATRQ